MSSVFLSNLLTNTTSRYNSLRRQLLNEEVDGDTEDDSHISRALRAYYTEKGRPFPPWLPPDPKAPQSAPAQFVSSSGRQPGGAPMGGRGGGLSDLWDSSPQQPPQQDPLSLRRAQGRGGGGRPLGRAGMGNSLTPEPEVQGRPLPSQRAGSYQSSLGGRPVDQSPPPSAGSGTTAQERLKARLWGSGRSTSPSQGSSATNTSPAPGGMRGPFDRPSGGGGRPPYPEERSSGRNQNSYGMSSNAPWSGGDDPYAPPSQGYGGGGRVGLPSGPRKRY